MRPPGFEPGITGSLHNLWEASVLSRLDYDRNINLVKDCIKRLMMKRGSNEEMISAGKTEIYA